MQSYTESKPRKSRGPGKRKCLRCGRIHKPVSESTKFCGSCSAKLLWTAWQRLSP